MKATLPELQIFAEVFGLKLEVMDDPANLMSKHVFSNSTGKRYAVELPQMITEEKLNEVINTAADHFGIVLH